MGAQETGSLEQLAHLPRLIVATETCDGEHVFDTSSYATTPGHGLAALEEMVGWPLPPDLIEFYSLVEKALLVTRTYPLHFWHEAKIIEETQERFRDHFTKPLRVFRFGDHFDMEATQFGLWLEEPGTMKWRVISTAIGCLDDLDDDYVEPDRILGASFYEWLKDYVERDGLPDPFMGLGPEGGFLDPA